jgi:hypothetical protein
MYSKAASNLTAKIQKYVLEKEASDAQWFCKPHDEEAAEVNIYLFFSSNHKRQL